MGKSWKNAGKTAAAQQKGKLFSKLAKEIQVAAKLGGGEPDSNPRLRLAINAARSASCPRDTIERAIKKGTGQLEGGIIEEIIYEGYGPHQVGVMVLCQTDNRNRTTPEVRNVFNRKGGNMGEQGSVAWMFETVCMVRGKKDEPPQDPEEEAIEVNAGEVEKDADSFIFYGAVSDLDEIRNALTDRGWEIEEAELYYKPKNSTDLSPEQRQEVEDFLEALDDLEDSSRIYTTL